MRASILVSLAFLFTFSAPAYSFEIITVYHSNLVFTASSLEATRIVESFEAKPLNSELDQLLRETVERTISLLPSQYLPKSLELFLEDGATFTDLKGRTEYLPLSMFLTVQLPTQNAIRISNFDMKNPESIRTIIAHEMGHMLMEWACHAAGVTKPGKTMSHWSGAIYEGVADYISASVNNTNFIGGPNEWFTRDILQFKTLDEAMQSQLRSIDVVERGLLSQGLIPRYRTYSEIIAEYKSELAQIPDYHDSYTIGSWLAGQLWQLGRVKGQKEVFEAILQIAISGQKFDRPDMFLSSVQAKIGL